MTEKEGKEERFGLQPPVQGIHWGVLSYLIHRMSEETAEFR